MDTTKKVEIEIKHMYWYLIETCRYGYTRNNHLMPADAFDTCRKLLPRVAEADLEYAIYTAKQLAEEAISMELLIHFYEKVDDQFGNMAETIKFIEDLLKFIEDNAKGGNKMLKPYNYDSYLEFIGKAK